MHHYNESLKALILKLRKQGIDENNWDRPYPTIGMPGTVTALSGEYGVVVVEIKRGGLTVGVKTVERRRTDNLGLTDQGQEYEHFLDKPWGKTEYYTKRQSGIALVNILNHRPNL